MSSKLVQMQAKFQQRQLQDKEERLFKLSKNQERRTIGYINKNSVGDAAAITTTTRVLTTSVHGGKVRQMFDERRQKAGVDRSYPLVPLKTTTNYIAKSLPDEKKNTNARTPIVQKTEASSIEKSVISKQKVIEDDRHEKTNENVEHNFENEVTGIIKEDSDLVTLMNNHNLYNNIDKEQMPIVKFDVVTKPVPIGKLANVGGILPSQTEFNRKLLVKSNEKVAANQIQLNKATHPKSLLKNSQTTSKRSPLTRPKVIVDSSAKHSLSPSKKNMSAKRLPPNQDRVPSTNRPSARQTPRGTPSAVTKDELATCKFCNRRFAPDRLQIHEDICAKTGKKKRKQYDAVKHRVQGTELEPFTRKSFRVTPKVSKPESTKKTNWRQTHDEFISAIRSAKMTQAHLAKGGKLSDLPPPPASTHPDYVQCPHCGRKFNETAAARHVPKCATYEFNKPKSQSSKTGQKVLGRAPYR